MLSASSASGILSFSTQHSHRISHYLRFKSVKVKAKDNNMVDAGPRTAKFLWFLSLIAELGYQMGWLRFNFWSIWSLTSIIDKTYKLISSDTELAFIEWWDGVWDSLFNNRPRRPPPPQGEAGVRGYDFPDREMPIIIPR